MLVWIKWSRMKIREVDDTEGPGKLEGGQLVRIHRYGGGDAVGRSTEDVDATELIEDMFAMVLQ